MSLLAPTLHGQTTSLAESLFRQGRAAMKTGDYAAACPKFEESHRLDASVGTLLNLALCEEARGHVATAAARFRELIEVASPSDTRVALAREHLASLSPRLPHLVLRAHQASGIAQLSLDGVHLSLASLDGPLQIDPGTHTLHTIARGQETSRSFSVRESETLDLWIDLESAPVPASSSAAPVASLAPPVALATVTPLASAPPPVTLPLTPLTASPPSPRWVPWTLLGVGSAGLVTSAVAGLVALHSKGVVQDECPDRQCTSDGLAAARRGDSAVRVANVAFAVGIIGVGAGAGLLILMRPGGSTVALQGQW